MCSPTRHQERSAKSILKVEFHLHQGTAEQIAEMGKLGRIDFAIATGSQQLFPEHVLLPCYQWHRRIVVPRNHPLAAVRAPTLEQLAQYPLVTYVFSFELAPPH